jgi:hypothetical protein
MSIAEIYMHGYLPTTGLFIRVLRIYAFSYRMDSMNTETPQKILSDIQTGTGWSQPRIAKETGTSQATICRLMNGQHECKSSTWRALLELRDRVQKKSRLARPPRKPPTVPT